MGLATLAPMPKLQTRKRVPRNARLWTYAFLCVSVSACDVPLPEDAVWVRIPEGASLEAIAESLATYEVVRSADSFERFARMGRKHEGIKPGVYPLAPGTAMGRVLAILRKGRPPADRIEVPGGIWLPELAVRIESHLGIAAESVSAAARDSGLLRAVGARGETVEGYLYPTEYWVPTGSSAMAVLRQMVDTFEARWRPEWNARLDTLGFTRDELVTLASIIEGEDPHHLDRFYVSSVYHNRLKANRRLQADPTVVYALGERRRLYNKDYAFRSEFNTYRVAGLPPAPISQPTVASLEAALYPFETDFYYFVARPDGRHLFSRSYREHLVTIRDVRGRSRRRRSTDR